MKILQKSDIFALFVFFIIFSFPGLAGAQFFQHGKPDFSTLHPDSVLRLDNAISRMEHEPGELLVKFRDDIKINVSKTNGVVRTGIPSVDILLNNYAVLEAEQLIRGASAIVEKQLLTAPNGRQFERPSLHNIYLLRAEKNDATIFELIRALDELPSVEYAELNFIYRLVDYSIDSPVMTLDDLKVYNSELDNQNNKNTITPNDPMFDQQWWISAIGADQVWAQTTGSTDQVIAILDTGVDWTHPDLQNKIWQNPGETANGKDSDGNGFVDDIRGWDFINHDNNPMDDNSHGTHVAGIAAAEGDNGIGIAGVSWGAKIMPVKILQSSGSGTAAVISQGIHYAASNGATVINMSFGGYAMSMVMRDALANAYATAVLVAAAGNDGGSIGVGSPFCKPLFPAAFSFVLGVEASQEFPGLCGARACYSNYDQDGPIYSAYSELFNYELLAPGSQIISTIPGGNYRIYSGTSMAAPVVAGGVSVYHSVHPEHPQEVMWSNLIHSSDDVFDLMSSLEGISDARLAFISHVLVDTLYGDGDGRPDAGETIEIWKTLRNTGAQVNNVHVGLRFSEFEDTTVATILEDHAYIGSMSSYATRTNEGTPFLVEINADVINDRQIVFEVYAFNEGTTDTIFQPLVITVQNGTKLFGVMDSTMVLTSCRLWLINDSFKIGKNGHLIINPGTKIINTRGIINDGIISSIGKPDSLIFIYGPGGFQGSSNNSSASFVFTVFKDQYWINNVTHTVGFHLPNSSYTNCQFIDINAVVLFNTAPNLLENRFISIKCGALFSSGLDNNSIVERNTFSNSQLLSGLPHQWSSILNEAGFFRYNIFSNVGVYSHSYGPPNLFMVQDNLTENHYGNSFIGFEDNYATLAARGNSPIISLPNQYWGTVDKRKIEIMHRDFWENPTLPQFDYLGLLASPSESSHGHVWRILVNGADAQDEYVDPVGVGEHRFDVFFNRAMDIEYTPMVTFGVRYPYTQQAVNENGSWSADSTIFTIYKTIQLYTGDGINRVRVAGARDTAGFEIPVEDMRFEFLIDAAGAASAGFMATPGMGKVDLEWDDPGELEDLLGYNMYRFEHNTDTTFTKPELLNSRLILEPQHTDFDVEPGEQYYYYYKILRTNLAETDSSRVVSSIPHTAAPGDANGDYNVDVLDIVAIVSYMLAQNPQPFIFEAADINGDGVINILDVVGVIHLINQEKGLARNKVATSLDPAFIFLENNLIRLESEGQLAALQFELQTNFPEYIQLTSAIPGFELAWAVTESGIRGILFNMHGNTIEKGLTEIIHIEHKNPDLVWGDIFGSDPSGRHVDVLTQTVGIDERTALPLAFSMELYPNPAKDQVTVDYFLPVLSDVQVVFYDIFGRELKTITSGRLTAGKYTHTIGTESLGHFSQGLVFCRITAMGANGENFQKTLRLMLVK